MKKKRVTKKSKLEFLKYKLGTDRFWCINGLRRILNSQTYEEKKIGLTCEKNGIGFSKYHADVVTRLLLIHKRTKYLNNYQWGILLKIAPQYRKQILDISIDEKLIYNMKLDKYL